MSETISRYKTTNKIYYCAKCLRRLTKDEVNTRSAFNFIRTKPGNANPLLCKFCHNPVRTKPRLKSAKKWEVKRY